ncbi:MAG: hypothetical protein Q7T10_16095 [Rhodoferax sp.]|uniref:type IV pilus assembly protein FimV n=1 Tax=Rhodoferax sp. TaxID=50421 RepID=UPI002723DB8E|nr:hypothetical protein [Rhodoferax sp.]MDO8450320.1 hypothetical protein [Rhodoferax sp.]
MEHRAKIIGIALLCVALGSEALTLGRIRGAALVGRPLDMVVPVQMDAGEDASSLCFDAEVFHADTRQDASRVRVVVEATAQPHTANVRILSSAMVDEPVVTVYLRTGCGQKTSRRYVLLADLQSEVAAPTTPLVVPASAPTPVPSKTNLAPTAPVSSAKAPAARVPKQTVRSRVDSKRPDSKAVAPVHQEAMSGNKGKVALSAGQSRLKLDPLELLSDRVANLDADMTFPPSEDALRNMQKTQALEEDVKVLRALAAKNEVNLVDLKSRLQKAESERFPSGLIYGLMALVLACLVAVALLWNRQRRAPTTGDEWWSGSLAAPTLPETEPEIPTGPITAHKSLGAPPASGKSRTGGSPKAVNDARQSSEVDVNLMEMSQSKFDDLMQPGVARSASRNQPGPPLQAEVPQVRLASNLNADATLDIRQQAEFFVSLGQTDQAVKLLQKQIDASREPNPFVYLDLLNIFHSLSLKTDFQRLREDFNRLFSGKVPEFALFKNQGKDLESYPDVLSRISALWPTPKVLEVLETCIVRRHRDATSQTFDLAAFGDLLLLHTVAQRLAVAPLQGGREPGTGSSLGVAVSESLAHHAAGPAFVSAAPPGGLGRPASMELDLSLDEVPPSRVLDLDLTDLGIDGFAANPVSAADADLPLLMPDDDEINGLGDGAIPPLENGNMVDFYLPETPKRSGPPGN